MYGRIGTSEQSSPFFLPYQESVLAGVYTASTLSEDYSPPTTRLRPLNGAATVSSEVLWRHTQRGQSGLGMWCGCLERTKPVYVRGKLGHSCTLESMWQNRSLHYSIVVWSRALYIIEPDCTYRTHNHYRNAFLGKWLERTILLLRNQDIAQFREINWSVMQKIRSCHYIVIASCNI